MPNGRLMTLAWGDKCSVGDQLGREIDYTDVMRDAGTARAWSAIFLPPGLRRLLICFLAICSARGWCGVCG